MKRTSFLCTILAMVMVACCLAANTISARLGIFFGGWVAPMGVFSFPLIYVISDIVSDVYGYRVSRWIAWMTIAVNFVFLGLVMGPCALIPAIDASMDVAVWTLFKPSIMVIIGSIVGAIMGGWMNDIIFQIFRHRDGTKRFYLRKVLSSLGAEIVDTVVFLTVAFGLGMGLWSLLPTMMIVQFLLKYGVEIVLMFPTKGVVNLIRKHEPNDVFEDRNQFNIFGFSKR